MRGEGCSECPGWTYTSPDNTTHLTVGKWYPHHSLTCMDFVGSVDRWSVSENKWEHLLPSLGGKGCPFNPKVLSFPHLADHLPDSTISPNSGKGLPGRGDVPSMGAQLSVPGPLSRGSLEAPSPDGQAPSHLPAHARVLTGRVIQGPPSWEIPNGSHPETHDRIYHVAMMTVYKEGEDSEDIDTRSHSSEESGEGKSPKLAIEPPLPTNGLKRP